MTPSSLEQWQDPKVIVSVVALIASLVSIVFTWRVDKRGRRLGDKDRVATIARIMHILRLAEECLPGRPVDDLRAWVREHHDAIDTLADTCRDAAGEAASTFATADHSLLEAYDALKDILIEKGTALDRHDTRREQLNAFSRLYHLFRLLSLAVATREYRKNPQATDGKLREDRYRQEFRARYEAFRIARYDATWR